MPLTPHKETLEALPVAGFLATVSGEIIYANLSFLALFKTTIGEAIGRNWTGFLEPIDAEQARKAWQNASFNRAVFRGCYQTLADKSKVFFLAGPLAPQVAGPQRAIPAPLYVTLAVDSAEVVPGSESKNQNKIFAPGSNDRNHDFLANISHELRTPLNGIIGMTELLLDSELGTQQRDYIETVLDSSKALLAIVNDLLDFSRLSAGHVQFSAGDFDLAKSLAGTLRLMDFQARKKRQELLSYIEADVPRALRGDLGRFKQVLINLLGNAIKFTPEGGGILVYGNVEEIRAPNAKLHFSVSDSGVGIPPHEIEHIFDPFVQVDNSTTRKFGGTGLGLSICKTLVELMGGRIWCESRPGVGSVFHFTCAFHVINPEKRSDLDDGVSPLVDKTILIAQGNPTSLEHLSAILSKWRARPLGVLDGHAAIAQHSQNLDSGNPFAVALIDAELPGIDGFEVASRVKKGAGDKSRVVMILTRENYRDGLIKCRALGLEGVLVKPISHSSLLDVVQGVLNPEESFSRSPRVSRFGVWTDPDSPVDNPPPGQYPEARVLLVEDNIVNQKLTLALLKRRGVMAQIASNGLEALKLMEREKFDLVLMDVQIPEVDGIEVTRRIRIREIDTGGYTPIVALTAHAMTAERVRCLEAGMDDFLSKPIDSNDFFATIDKFLLRERLSTE